MASSSTPKSTEPRTSYLDPFILKQLQLPLQMIPKNQGRAKGEDKSNDEDGVPSFRLLQNKDDGDDASKQSKQDPDAVIKSCSIDSMQDLAVYAVACDEYLLWKTTTTNNETTAEDRTTSSDIDQVLYQLASHSNHSVVATLFATNRLESAVRAATGFSRGKAPLLKDMIQNIKDVNLRQMLELLLLPSGLNLRNLVWHGFVSTSELPQSWCALCLVLTNQLVLKQQQTASPPNDHDPNKDDITKILDVRRTNSELVQSLDDAHQLLETSDQQKVYDTIFHWIPPTHQSQFELAWDWKETKPTCAIAILCILLEHCLRIEWCHCNQLVEHSQARPNAYYVTLDGHGQRHLHDVLLDPYLSTGSKNQLIPTLDGPLTALLTDLFCAPNGGPNLRATVSHGTWDAFIEAELLQEPYSSSMQRDKLCDWQRILIFVMYQCAVACQNDGSGGASLVYRPVFSYTAVMNRLVEQVTYQLQSIQDLLHDYDVPSSTLLLPTIDLSTWSKLTKVQNRLFIQWTTAESVWEEAKLNEILGGNCNLIRALLDDLVQVTLALKDWIITTQQTALDEPNLPPKQHAKFQRRLHHASMAYNLYQFSFQLCILALEHHLDHNGDDGAEIAVLTTALKRSRMVISTVSTFVHTNPDRARKAYQTYCQGKAVKAILQNQCMFK